MSGNDELKAPHSDPHRDGRDGRDGTDEFRERVQDGPGDGLRDGLRDGEDATARTGNEPAHDHATSRDGDELARSEARTDRIPPQAMGDHDDDPPGGPCAEQAPAHAAPDDIVLFDQDPTQVQARWRDLQASFVDDPGEAVRRADGLVGEVVESLTSSLTSRTAALRGRWKDAGGAETEQLRLALRDYRNVLERLLALSGSPSPQQGAGQADEARHSVLGTR
jgi:hypothetical protein